ncbi:MAG: fused MFS/spermidine synthase [Thermodesulfobacteriota bacterium]
MKSIVFSFFLAGLAALAGQLVFIRELLVVFYGNELSAAVVLAVWLVFTSGGSLFLGRLTGGLENKRRALSLTLAALAVILPLTVVFIRLVKVVWKIPVGEAAAPSIMILISLSTLALPGLLTGFLFALGCSLRVEAGSGATGSISLVYLWEALGSALGGLVLAALLTLHLNHLQVLMLVSGLLLSVSFFLLVDAAAVPGKKLLYLVGGLVMTVLAVGLVIQSDRWERKSRAWSWPGYRLLETVETPYGHLAALEAQGQTSFHENGLRLFTSPDPLQAEESVHFALLQHPAPATIMLVGGGLSGALAEVLKHPPVRRVDYVELDPELVALARRVLPFPATTALDDPRVNLVHGDGRGFIKTAEPGYDVVIINLPDPRTAQLNRFYTTDFFLEVKRILAPAGVLSFGLTSSENVIGPTLARLLSSMRQTLAGTFPEVLVLPGATARYFGALSPGLLVSDPALLVDRIRARNLRLEYVRDYYLLFNLSPERLAYFQRMIEAGGGTGLNQDLEPICYYYDLIHWSAQYSPVFKEAFLWLGGIKTAHVLLVIGLIALVIRLFTRFKRGAASFRPALLFACFSAGCSGLVLSLVLILAFQILCGYAYYQIVILVSAYMAGLAAGCRRAANGLARGNRPWPGLLVVQGSLVLYPILVSGVILVLKGGMDSSQAPVFIESLFGVLSFLAGYIGGGHFLLATSLYLTAGLETGRTAGLVYGMDLAGSALGAVAAGLVLLPVLGLTSTLGLAAGLNLFNLALLTLTMPPKSANY